MAVAHRYCEIEDCVSNRLHLARSITKHYSDAVILILSCSSFIIPKSNILHLVVVSGQNLS